MPRKASKKSDKKAYKRVHKKAHKNTVDVMSGEDLPALHDLFKKNKMVVVLVWADYCGHCHKYMDDVWNPLTALKNRHKDIGMAKIHHDQMQNTPFSGATLNGYPTVLLLGNDKVPAKFKDANTGEDINEFQESRNVPVMTTLLTSDPEESLSRLPNVSVPPNVNSNESEDLESSSDEEEDMNESSSDEEMNEYPTDFTNTKINDVDNAESLPINKSASVSRNSITVQNLKKSLNRNTVNGSPTTPPPIQNDMMNSQTGFENVHQVNFTPSKKVGGSLYESLLKVAPAVMLTGAAVLSRRGLKTRKGSKSSKGQTRHRGRRGSRRSK